MFLRLKSFALAAICAVTLGACARNMDSNVYTSSSASGKAIEGVIVSARPVTIRENERLQDNALGGLAGGVAGGVVGSTIGKGSGNTLATVGGALAGAVAGAAVQQQLGKSQGYEYVIRVSPKYAHQHNSVYRSHERVDVNNSRPSQDVSSSVSVSPSQTDLITVIQSDKTLLQPGQRVLVIYSDDRPRVVPAYH